MTLTSDMWADLDLGAELLDAGGAEAFMARGLSLRDIPALAAAVDKQRDLLAEATTNISGHSQAVRQTSLSQLRAAQARLALASDMATQARTENNAHRERLQRVADTFAEYRAACGEEDAVTKCRVIADAYVNVLRTLQLHHQHGDATPNVDRVAANIAVLIQQVDIIRRAGPKSFFGESLAVNKKILASIENRCVDAVIKARAAFVNVMDNRFRSFGWPMKVPKVTENQDMINTVNFYVQQLAKLQKVAQDYSFVAQRTHWHRSLSDSWAMAAILRAPLARFKYHFLENFRASLSAHGEDDAMSNSSSVVQDEIAAAGAADGALAATTTRFDRPEWAAEFALERIEEAAPFLKEIVLDDTCTADLKYAEGFCKVFAKKMSYDCDLAIRGSDGSWSADPLMSHTADTAAQFDRKLREGILSKNPLYAANHVIPSALDILSLDEHFFANWALAEQRITQVDVLSSVENLLARRHDEKNGLLDSARSSLDASGSSPPSNMEIEEECADIVDRISQSSRRCRGLSSRDLQLKFVRWTEFHILEAVRARLQDQLNGCDWEPRSGDEVLFAGRAAWISHAMAVVLEDRVCDGFYVALAARSEDDSFHAAPPTTTNEEEQSLSSLGAASRSGMANGGSVSLFREEVSRYRMLHGKICKAIERSISDAFSASVREEYLELVRFGELPAPNAAIVLEHDLSSALCKCMEELDVQLRGLSEGVQNRKLARFIWRGVAERVDLFFFEEVILPSFTGGQRNAVSAASVQNGYMIGRSAAQMARQIAHDASVLVSVFGRVTSAPERFLGRCSDASKLMSIGASRVLRPRAPVPQHEAELLAAAVVGRGGRKEGAVDCLDVDERRTEVEDGSAANTVARSTGEGKEEDSSIMQLRRAGIGTLSEREALECLVVSGMYELVSVE